MLCLSFQICDVYTKLLVYPVVLIMHCVSEKLFK